MTSPLCQACNAAKSRFWFEKNSFGAVYKIYRCRGCGTGFVHPRPEARVIKEIYENEDWRGSRSTRQSVWTDQVKSELRYQNTIIDAQRIARKSRKIIGGGKALEIGAGIGLLTRELTKCGYHVDAVEPGLENKKIFQVVNGFKPVADFFDDGFVKGGLPAYDLVVMSQVLEHMVDPRRVIGDIAKIVKRGGGIAIAVPNSMSTVAAIQGRRDMFICPPIHLTYFTVNGLCSLLKGAGFSPIEESTVSRYDKARVAGKMGISQLLGDIALLPLSVALKISDALKLGMYINAYFIKK